jgi:hypothetical protein
MQKDVRNKKYKIEYFKWVMYNKFIKNQKYKIHVYNK